ncbi:MAG: flagellar biosynthetic protein FliR [Sphingomonadales bacterium]|nr:flagellar biosynthetic protein FliR [Sphingomonadales bacterium]
MSLPGLGFGPLEAEFWRWMFLMTRIGAAMFAAPIFGAANVAPQVRVIATAAVAALVAGWSDARAPAALFSAAGMMAVLGEVLVGLALGFVLQFAFASPVIAAELIGGGMGLSLAAAADPQDGARAPLLGQYFSVVLTLVFLAMGAHLQWVALLLRSYAVFPPGQTWLGPARLLAIAGFAGAMFTTALAMALPVVLVLLLTQLATGVLGRSAPALNLFSLGLPAGIIAGLAALIASAPLMSDRMSDLAIAATGEVAQILPATAR